MRARRRDGFALLLTVLVFAIGTIMIGVMIDRQFSSTNSTRRHLDQHVGHHASRGLQECVEQYLMPFLSDSIEAQMGPDGHLLDFVLQDGRVIRVYLIDGQGAMLSDLTALTDASQRETGLAAMAHLRELMGRRRPPPELLRRYGPLAVSAVTAPKEVLEAMLVATLGPGGASRLAAEIVSQRERDGLDATGLSEAIGRVAREGEARAAIEALLTVSPVLWNGRIEIIRKHLARRDEVVKYRAVIEIERGPARRGTSDPFASPVKFLEWDRLPDE